MLKNLPKFAFMCKKCKKTVSHRIENRIAECDTPIGCIRQICFRAYCEEYGSELTNRDLKNYNYFAMVVATISFWRKKYPNGTKKQCHRDLAIAKNAVDFCWENCLDEVSHPRYNLTGDKDSKNKFVNTINNKIETADSTGLKRAQHVNQDCVIVSVSLDSIVESNPNWVKYPDIFAQFKVIGISGGESEKNKDKENNDICEDSIDDVLPNVDELQNNICESNVATANEESGNKFFDYEE